MQPGFAVFQWRITAKRRNLYDFSGFLHREPAEETHFH
jgi:hypothetical protein